MLYSCYVTQLDVPSRQTTPTRHIRVLGSSFRCLDKEDKRPQKITTLDSVYGIPATSIFVFEASVLGSGSMGGRDKLLSVSAGAQCMRDDGSKVAESAKRPTPGTWRGELVVPVVVCEVM